MFTGKRLSRNLNTEEGLSRPREGVGGWPPPDDLFVGAKPSPQSRFELSRITLGPDGNGGDGTNGNGDY